MGSYWQKEGLNIIATNLGIFVYSCILLPKKKKEEKKN